ncbi:Uncharacterised protein [Bordetella pertussis]|nr:Uncharacterised protein [Bordetella pertussis]
MYTAGLYGDCSSPASGCATHGVVGISKALTPAIACVNVSIIALRRPSNPA